MHFTLVLAAFALIATIGRVAAGDLPPCAVHANGDVLKYPTSLLVPFSNPPAEKYDDVWQDTTSNFMAHAKRGTCLSSGKTGLLLVLSAEKTAHSGSTTGPGNVWRVQVAPGEKGAAKEYLYFNLKHGDQCFMCYDFADNIKATAIDVSRDM